MDRKEDERKADDRGSLHWLGRAQCASTESGNMRPESSLVEGCDESTFGTLKRNGRHEGGERYLALPTVSIWLNVAVCPPSDKHASVLGKLLWNETLLKLGSYLCNLSLKALALAFKPIILGYELIYMIAKERNALLQNSGAPVLGDEPLQLSKNRDTHNAEG